MTPMNNPLKSLRVAFIVQLFTFQMATMENPMESFANVRAGQIPVNQALFAAVTHP